MRAARGGSISTLNVSALDLFATALGVFVVMFIILMPFYLKRPSVESGLAGARADLAESEAAMADAKARAASARRDLAEARESLGGVEAENEQRMADLQELDKALQEAQAALAARPKPQSDTVQSRRRGGGNISIKPLDLVMVMDTTGSMGRELKDVQANLASLARILNRLSPDLRLGFVAYKDTDTPPVLRTFPLSRMSGDNLRKMLRFVRGLTARGGGDVPEPVDKALEAAISMNWSGSASGRIIVIGDAPAHGGNQARSYSAARGFVQSGPGGEFDRRISAILTGDNGGARDYFMRLARSGNGDLSAHRGAIVESVLLSILK